MILETALGSLFGGALRLAPEVLKWLDRKNERAHEIAMQQLSLQAAREQSEAKLRELDAQASAAFDAGAMQALVESIKSQGQPTGIKFVDGISGLVRPVITFWFFGLYATARIAAFVVAVNTGTPALTALASVWTPEDHAMLSGILAFWFVGRVWDRGR